MAKRPSKPTELPDALRDAVERTVQATVGSAGRSRDRTQGALDDLVDTVDRLVKGAESSLSQRGKAAVDAIEDRRPVTHEDFRELRSELRRISRRLDAIEERLPAKRKPAAKRRS
jgi:ABC-type transporter Mla subunit MlaD